MSDDEDRAGDKAAWQHAAESGRFVFMTHEEIQKLILVQLHTAKRIDPREGGVPEKEILALVEWANKTRASDAMLQNVLSGSAYVRMKGREPQFELTSRGLAEGRQLAEQMGLPTDGLTK